MLMRWLSSRVWASNAIVLRCALTGSLAVLRVVLLVLVIAHPPHHFPDKKAFPFPAMPSWNHDNLAMEPRQFDFFEPFLNL